MWIISQIIEEVGQHPFSHATLVPVALSPPMEACLLSSEFTLGKGWLVLFCFSGVSDFFLPGEERL